MNWRPSSSSRRASTSCYSESLRSHAGVSGQGTGCVTCSAVVMLLLQAQMLFPVHWCHRWWRRPLNRMTVLLSTRTVVGENTTQWTCVCVPVLRPLLTRHLHTPLWSLKSLHCWAQWSMCMYMHFLCHSVISSDHLHVCSISDFAFITHTSAHTLVPTSQQLMCMYTCLCIQHQSLSYK